MLDFPFKKCYWICMPYTGNKLQLSFSDPKGATSMPEQMGPASYSITQHESRRGRQIEPKEKGERRNERREIGWKTHYNVQFLSPYQAEQKFKKYLFEVDKEICQRLVVQSFCTFILSVIKHNLKKGCHPLWMDLKYICLISHISTL